jgi:hypothetical protein
MVSWVKHQDHVCEIARIKWNANCGPEHIDGVDFDLVVRISRGELILIECTEERDIDKIRKDINRINPVRMKFLINGIICRAFIVLSKDPTAQMVETGEASNITVCSITQFENEFFNFGEYMSLRSNYPFGSAVDPKTGATDQHIYVPVNYFDVNRDREFNVSSIVSDLISRKKIILTGDYGTGKSRCIKEIFFDLSKKIRQSGAYPLAINLRDHWGSRSKIEIITGHLQAIGMGASIDNVVRLLNRGNMVLLLDGFDEVGAQTLDLRHRDRVAIRAGALEGIRDLISSTNCPVFVVGRSHYFDSDEEMLRSLGLKNAEAIRVLRCLDEFSDSQTKTYFSNIGLSVDVPEWLPKKPLIFQIISNFSKDFVADVMKKKNGQNEFWSSFVNAICLREASIHGSLDAESVRSVLLELAQITRSHSALLGRLDPSFISRAYETALGNSPDDVGQLMLSRLCSLGRIEPHSPDRQFVDDKLLDILRAERLISDIVSSEPSISGEDWKHALGLVGCNYAAFTVETFDLELDFISFINRFKDKAKKQQLAEIISVLSIIPGEKIELHGVAIDDSHFPIIDVSKREICNLNINESIINILILSKTKITQKSQFVINNSLFMEVFGIAGDEGKPSWINEWDVKKIEKIDNASRIRESNISPAHKLFLSIVHKIFFQKGRGREEASLQKGGFGQKYSPALIDDIIRLLLREPLIRKSKGVDGFVYHPIRTHTRRMAKIVSELSLSEDPLWLEIDKLN